MGVNILDNLLQELEEFEAWLNAKDKILNRIDVKDSLISDLNQSVKTESLIMQAEDRSVNVFIYETEQNLYMLNCNLAGKKIKHEEFPYSALDLTLTKNSLGHNFMLTAKNGWYYKGKICEIATTQLRELAKRRNIPVKEAVDGEFVTFVKKYPLAVYFSVTFVLAVIVALWQVLS